MITLDLYICTYLVYEDDQTKNITDIGSFTLTAYDFERAEESVEDYLQTKFSDKETWYKIQIVDKSVYSKVLLDHYTFKQITEYVN